MNPKEIILGIDFGQTIESKDADGKKVENPRAMEVIARCVKHCKKVYIISKVTPEQKIGLLRWVYDNNFYKQTGLTRTDIHFCTERYEKGPIARDLKINCFIDDRPEVMVWMPKNVYKILFQPIRMDVVKWGQEDTDIVNSWNEIEDLIFGENQ